MGLAPLRHTVVVDSLGRVITGLSERWSLRRLIRLQDSLNGHLVFPLSLSFRRLPK